MCFYIHKIIYLDKGFNLTFQNKTNKAKVGKEIIKLQQGLKINNRTKRTLILKNRVVFQYRLVQI